MQEPQPPRRKLHVLWVLAALVFLFAVWFCYQLFGPNPAIVVSKETTFITEPLGPDGLPDYEAYLLEQGSKGVTPENNAAVLIWQAMWPGGLEQEHWLLMCDALGMEKMPSAKDALVPPYDKTVRDKIVLELAKRFSEQASGAEPKEDYFSDAWQNQLRDGAAYDLVGEAGAHPWTSEQIPALAKWVEQNQKPLDLLVEASKRPRYYSPSPSMLDGSKDMLLAAPLLLDVQMMRGTLRALQVRAMWHLGEGRTAEAWKNFLACHRIARLTSENPTLVSQLVALAIDGVACNVTTPFLHHANLDIEAAKQILAELQNLGPASSCVRAMDQGERLSFLDTVLYIATDEKGHLADLLGIPTELAEIVRRARVDWNEVLRQGNAWFDELVVAAKLTTREERRDAFEQTDQKTRQMSSQGNSPSAWVGSVLNGKRRTEMVKGVLISILLPSTSVALIVEDRTNTQLELTRLAAALTVYRAEQGAYPEQLTELVPAVLPKLPVDLYSGKSFLYERKDDGGYLLYSVFENGIDDGGDSMSGEIIDGEWVGEQPEGFDYSESDIVIRVPVPAFEFPELPQESER